MQTKKMSLANIQGKLSRAEMKNIMAGSGGTCCFHNTGWEIFGCGISQGEAQSLATQYASETGNHGYWCCSSC